MSKSASRRPARSRSRAEPRASTRADSSFQPQLATLVAEAPSSDEWLHEIKYDGYRIGCLVAGARVRLLTRNGQDWTEGFGPVVEAVRALGLKRALLDGEVAIVLPDGRTSFQGLQNAGRGRGSAGQLVYFVFDLLHLDDQDWTSFPLEQRKARLAELLAEAPKDGVLRLAQHIEGRGADVLAQACKLGLEGIISKRRDQPYRAGRNLSWVKTKCLKRQEFVVGGFTEPEGRRVGLGALLLGYYDDRGALRFAGKAGNGPGFTATYTAGLRRELEPLVQASCPFTPPPPRTVAAHAHWTAPKRVVEVSFTEWTEGGAVRHPLILGMRADKPARDVRREQPSAGDETAQAAPRAPGAAKKRTRHQKSKATKA